MDRPDLKKGFNDYQIVDDYAIIYLDRKNGSRVEAYVDASDIPFLIQLGLCWHIMYKRNGDNAYVTANRYYKVMGEPRKRHTTTLLHKTLINVHDRNLHVDHINHNGLDNRRNNLRLVPCELNCRNRYGKNANNKSGYRNVFYDNYIKKWVVIICKNGKRIKVGAFDDVDEAGVAAQNAREELFGEYAGLG